ncbi:hypothetical protein, partial [Streptomyces sp. C1-2]|uniref:hypothetical protein n=1 Tax=Streptomyces sp. C1-2 TaxID=2720022 RepID=UPI0019CF856D
DLARARAERDELREDDVFSLSRVAHVDMLGVVCGRDGGAAPFSRAPAPYTVMTGEAVRV